MGTTEDRSEELEAFETGTVTPPPSSIPRPRVVDEKTEPRMGMALMQSYRDILHALLHLTLSADELPRAGTTHASQGSLSPAQSLAGTVDAE